MEDNYNFGESKSLPALDLRGVSQAFREDIPIPVLTVVGFTVLPGNFAPISISDESSISAIEYSLNHSRFIFLSILREDAKNPKDAINQFGVVAAIIRAGRGLDGIYRALVSGLFRGKIESFANETPPYLVRVRIFDDKKPLIFNPELEALSRQALSLFGEYLSYLPIKPPQEFLHFLRTIQIPGNLADIIAGNLPLKPHEFQDFVETIDQNERFKKLLSILIREIEVAKIQQQISKRVQENIDRAQRIRILQEEIKEMQKELEKIEGGRSEIDELREKAEKLPDHVKKEVLKQIDRLSSIPKESPEHTVVMNWIEEVLALPWVERTQDNLDLRRAKEVLDEDHWNLQDVKERILEFLSQGALKGGIPRGTILCLVGPPGVGKTSLGKSIARAIGRRFVRISLGGVRDEAEIRGHRRTYVGAMPGKIIMGMKQAGSKNPVFMLDEVDKLSADFRGDPSAALLEVLDPEQNNSFVDHYISVPFDLSEVLFIATANFTGTIPLPLLDRMEIIDIPGYTDTDKLHIAKRYFIPRGLEETGLGKYKVEISDSAILEIINGYTREAGVRELSRKIQSVLRKLGKEILLGGVKLSNGKIFVEKEDIHKYLGAPRFKEYEDIKGEFVGIATGLAWTPVGGEILKIEVAIIPARSGISLTGSLGDVMKESAQAAVTYAKVNYKKLGIDKRKFSNGIHIHVPEGAVPKDGPSAGVAITVALVSALTQVPVVQDVAMTGEITLRGKILPVGGIREKVLAASRYGIRKVILPELNKSDLEKIPDEVKSNMQFFFVNHLDQVWDIVFPHKSVSSRRNKKVLASR